MADVYLNPEMGTYSKVGGAMYWGAGDRIRVRGSARIELWEETETEVFVVQITDEDDNCSVERVVLATGHWYFELGRDAEIQIDIHSKTAPGPYTMVFQVT